MVALDFGLLIHPTPRGGTLAAMRATNERLLAAAVEHDLTAWMIDHFQFDDQPILECFATLAHTAGRYPTLRWGTLVLGQGYRNPALTAKIAASLQFLTGGRFILGIGAGWKEDEYRAYGYPYPRRASGSRSSTRRCGSSGRSGPAGRPPSTARTTGSPTPVASRAPIPRRS